DDAVRADLARLTSFFFSDLFATVESADDQSSAENDDGPRVVLANSRAFAQQAAGCGVGSNQVSEMLIFGAADTSLCYQFITNDADDAVYVAVDSSAVDASDLIFSIIEEARTGYAELAGSELPPVRLLLSTRLSPPDSDDPNRANLAHVISNSATTCRVAVFATDTFFAGGPMFRFTIAHELFHCIQDTWQGDIPDAFTQEGGADYFAYKLLGECVAPEVALGQRLDKKTANGSLLDVADEGWFFWAFLDEQGHLTPQEIAQAHRAVSQGTSVPDGLSALISDLPSVMNEFYVRLMGPGLACGFQGSEVTDTKTVKDKGPIELKASLWQGTRYKLDYTKKRLFEQENKGPGRIGMAKFSNRSVEDDWVVTSPEVRTKCTEDEPWIVVVTALNDSKSAPPQVLDVTEMGDGVCDACLIGQWGLDIESVNAIFQKNIPGQSVDVTGSWTLEFGAAVDGATSATFTDKRDLQLQVQTGLATIPVDQIGNGNGTYTADETFLVVNAYSSSIVATALGITSGPSGFFGEGDRVAYICEKDSLTYTIGTDEWTASRIPDTPKGDPYFG
ncbi:MAG: ImmA/IrrE family metallo-endopeptidase, partial [Acidimicrobiales bacterium]